MVKQRKSEYSEKLNKYLDKYDKILSINVNNVSSKKVAETRLQLRPQDINILMGKNTIIRKVLRDRASHLQMIDPKASAGAEAMLEMINGNIGLMFVPENTNIAELRKQIVSDKVQSQAKAGVSAPSDVVVPAGPTGQDPSQTSFFQALDIPTKINRGQIEIVSDVQLIKKGEKVNRSAAELLIMLGIKPFYYGIGIQHVYDHGSLYPDRVLDISENDVAFAFSRSVLEVASLCLILNFPTTASVLHNIMDAYKNLVAVGLKCELYGWDNLLKIKNALANPIKINPKCTNITPSVTKIKADTEKEESSAVGALFGDSESNDNSGEESS